MDTDVGMEDASSMDVRFPELTGHVYDALSCSAGSVMDTAVNFALQEGSPMLFGLFRGKAKDAATERIFQHLGESSKGILSAASEGNDLAVALKGDAVVSEIIAESIRSFGLTIKPNTIFARFVSAAQEQDFAKLAQITKGMANALNKAPDQLHRGCLVHSWINGTN